MTEAGNNIVEPVPMPDSVRDALRPSSPSTMSSSRSSSASATGPIPKSLARRPPAARRTSNDGRDESAEGFLKRWSRRKTKASAKRRAPAEAGARCAAGSGAGRRRRVATLPTAPKPEFDPVEPAAARIRSTRGTDIRAFLAPGVPAELARAALRRAWTADPAIRDFVGLAENAWDFTDPTAMPGFGDCRRAPTSRSVAQVFGERR